MKSIINDLIIPSLFFEEVSNLERLDTNFLKRVFENKANLKIFFYDFNYANFIYKLVFNKEISVKELNKLFPAEITKRDLNRLKKGEIFLTKETFTELLKIAPLEDIFRIIRRGNFIETGLYLDLALESNANLSLNDLISIFDEIEKLVNIKKENFLEDVADRYLSKLELRSIGEKRAFIETLNKFTLFKFVSNKKLISFLKKLRESYSVVEENNYEKFSETEDILCSLNEENLKAIGYKLANNILIALDFFQDLEKALNSKSDFFKVKNKEVVYEKFYFPILKAFHKRLYKRNLISSIEFNNLENLRLDPHFLDVLNSNNVNKLLKEIILDIIKRADKELIRSILSSLYNKEIIKEVLDKYPNKRELSIIKIVSFSVHGRKGLESLFEKIRFLRQNNLPFCNTIADYYKLYNLLEENKEMIDLILKCLSSQELKTLTKLDPQLLSPQLFKKFKNSYKRSF